MESTNPVSINPFSDDIVNDPRRVKYSVPGLNQQVAESVTQAVGQLMLDERPRYHARSSKALLVTSPRAGFGKSHLIGMLFKQLSGSATLVNVRPFEDPETCWKSILMRMVQELNFPDRFNESSGNEHQPTQLELFSHGVFGQIIADHLASNQSQGNEKNIRILRKPAQDLVKLKNKPNWIQYLARHICDGRWLHLLEQRFLQNSLNLNTSPDSWLKILFHYAYKDQDWDITQGCLDWIQGEPIDEEIAKKIGLRPAARVSDQLTAGQVNDLSKRRILDLCLLAGFYRPFLICFDQTETYGKSPELARAWGRTITDLTDEAKNQQTFITVNLDPWEKRLRIYWEQASLDRLATPVLPLEGITQTQAEVLATHRLNTLQIDPARQKQFWADRSWLTRIFTSREQRSVREFLQDCAHQWLDEKATKTPKEKIPLADIFTHYKNTLSSKTRRLIFDRDSFYWLVNELAAGLKDVTIDSVSNGKGTQLTRWHYHDKIFIFCFEASNSWQVWKKIATNALHDDQQGSKKIPVYLRTPELTPIPKDTWNKTKETIDQAKVSQLLIKSLTQHELIRLYAAQDFYLDALQGDLEWQADEVATFLCQTLSDFWQSILDWPENSRDQSSLDSSPPPPRNQEETLRKSVLTIVKEKKFLSVEDLLKSLPDNTDQETILGICGEISNIKIHQSPQMVILQWQTTK